MNPDSVKMQVHATFLAAALALWGISGAPRPSAAATLPFGPDDVAIVLATSSCADDGASAPGYVGRFGALMATTAGGDGTGLAAAC